MRAIVWELVRRYEEAGHTRIRIKDMITEFLPAVETFPLAMGDQPGISFLHYAGYALRYA